MNSTDQTNEAKHRNGEPGRRLIAFIMDVIIILIIIFISAYTIGELNYTVRTQGNNSNIMVNVPWNSWSKLLGASVLGSFWFFLGSSPGKKMMKLQIRDRSTGTSPTLIKVVGRLIFYIPSMFVACLPFLQIPFNKDYRAWYDTMLNLDVIDLRSQ